MSIVYTKNTPFSLSDWKGERLRKIVCGADCVMALTEDGRALQKISREDCAARTEYWKNLRDIALSKTSCGMAMGLAEDGTCMIAKRPVRRLCEDRAGASFDRINGEVRSWKNVVQAAVSDAFFALDGEGRVHVANVYSAGYDTSSWEKVVRIVAGTAESLFGITEDGRVLCTGQNLTAGPHGDQRDRLAALRGVTDICAQGAECERIIYAASDGAVRELDGSVICESCASPVLEGNYLATLILSEGRVDCVQYTGDNRKLAAARKWKNVISCDVGVADYTEPFAVGLSVK